MRRTIHPARSRAFFWIGVAVPVALVVLALWNQVPSFDGAMNLQVAQSIADGDGFRRPYAGAALFPEEIQTSGYFMLLQALAIRLLGAGTVVFQLTNLVFLALLALGASLAVRRWPVARLIAPTLVILAVPRGAGVTGTLELGAGGYGEYAVAALAILAFVALAHAFESTSRRPYAMIALAGIAAGVAITIKIVAVLIVPVLAVGLVAGLIARRRCTPWRAILAAASGGIPIAAFEAYRLVSLGSWRAFTDNWGTETYAAALQAGVTGTNVYASSPAAHEGRTFFGKLAEHWMMLSQATGIDWLMLLVIVVAPAVILAALAYRHRETWREWLTDGQGLLAIQLAVYSGGYLVWWVAMTPTEKAWYRRIIVAVLCMILLYVVVTRLAIEELAGSARPIRRLATPAMAIGVTAMCAAVIAGTATASSLVESTVGAIRSGPWSADAPGRLRQQAVQQAAATVDHLASEGYTIYGMGWWSAPAVQIYTHGRIANLLAVDDIPCATDLLAGEAYLVWDTYAQRIADLYGTAPDSVAFAIEPELTTDYAKFYRILVTAEECTAPGEGH